MTGLSPDSSLFAKQARGDDYVLSFAELLGVLRRRLWVIALVAILAAGAVVAYSLHFQTPKYQSSVDILIGQKPTVGKQSYGSLGGDVQGLQDMTATVTQAVTTRSVAEEVIKNQHLSMTTDGFLKNVSAQEVPNTQFIEINYKSKDPRKAQQIANALGNVLSSRVSEVSTSASGITATVWDKAALPTTPVSPKPLRNGVLAFALGAIIGVLLAFLLEYLDDSWRSPEDVEQLSKLPTFGIIPEFNSSKKIKKGRA